MFAERPPVGRKASWVLERALASHLDSIKFESENRL
jgi:hypothetical protein